MSPVGIMFGQRDALPMHGGSQKNNGISGIPIVNKSVALSVLWVLVSVCLFVFGIWHCRNNGYRYSLKCSGNQCSYVAIKGSEISFTFPKSDLLDADLARVTDKGEFLDSEAMRKQKSNRAGYTIRFKARLPVDEGSPMKTEKAILLAPKDMGRREARKGVTSITQYLNYKDNESEDGLSEDEKKKSRWNKMLKSKNVDITHKCSFTALGAITAFLSLVSLIGAAFFGTWSETSRRARVKKAS